MGLGAMSPIEPEETLRLLVEPGEAGPWDAWQQVSLLSGKHATSHADGFFSPPYAPHALLIATAATIGRRPNHRRRNTCRTPRNRSKQKHWPGGNEAAAASGPPRRLQGLFPF